MTQFKTKEEAEEIQIPDTIENRMKLLPKEERVIYDTYLELLDMSRVHHGFKFPYAVKDKDGNFKTEFLPSDGVFNLSLYKFYKLIKELVAREKKKKRTFICLITHKLHPEKGEDFSEFCKKLQDTYDFEKCFVELREKFSVAI